jgi:hypothetical protein
VFVVSCLALVLRQFDSSVGVNIESKCKLATSHLRVFWFFLVFFFLFFFMAIFFYVFVFALFYILFHAFVLFVFMFV